MSGQDLVKDLFASIEVNPHELDNPEIAHLVVHENQVVSSKALPGLIVDVKELADGIQANILVKEGVVIKYPVHFCFGLLPQQGLQKIIMRVNIEKDAKIAVLAHCTFPNAIDVTHVMDGEIIVGEGAQYQYFERHVHGKTGGTKVYPNAKVELGKGARFKTEFELLKGRVGLIAINYETTCQADAVMEMTARINGSGDDHISIKETGNLVGERAVGVLNSRVAVTDHARAEVYNRIIATAAYARGHVDCKEIIQGQASAMATPIVEVKHPKAHVTHEAAIGSVDTKQLETLMSRGLGEEEAINLIVQGLLS